MDFKGYLKEYGKPVLMEKGAHVFRQGDQDTALYFIQKGLLKAYYLTLEGKEMIKSFLLPGDVMGSLKAAYKGQGNSFSLLCYEESELIQIDFSHLMKLGLEEKEITGTLFNFLLELALKKEQREYEFLCCTAQERFDLIKDRTHDLLEKIPQKEIALYLGITPVALSRILNRR